MTDTMTASLPPSSSHFSSRKRSYDDHLDNSDDDEVPQLLEPCAAPLGYNGESQINTQMLGMLRGSEDLDGEGASQESEGSGGGSLRVEEKDANVKKSEDGEGRGRSIVVLINSTPNTTAATTAAVPPPKKARTLTSQEMKAEKEANAAAEKARKLAEKEAEKARKDAEKAAEKQAAAEAKAQKKAADKAAKEAEKEAERLAEKAAKDAAKEAERVVKEAEKAEKEAEKAAKAKEKAEKEAEKAAEKSKKDAERAKREAEKKQKEESKIKAERSQMRLGNFFTTSTTPKDETKGAKSLLHNTSRSSMSPAPSAVSEAGTPSKPKISPYDALFPSFFVHKDVIVAPVSNFTFDETATELVMKNIDNSILGTESAIPEIKFDGQRMFFVHPVPRGRKVMPVREIMDELTGNSKRPLDLTTESQHSQIRRTKELLSRIPVKYLKFREDVRPPYIGTYTSRPIHGTASLARNPFKRELPDQNYDYDSEAEWVEDDEDAEDLKSENDEDEEPEDGEDMAEFLDDEGDELASTRRQIIQGDLEHTSTGLCWEDKHKKSTNVKMMPYRMEIMIDPKLKSIDPLSTSYWDDPKLMPPPPRIPLASTSSNSKAPSSTLKSFFSATSSDDQTSSSSTSGPSASKSDGPTRPAKMVRDEDMVQFRAEIKGSPLSQIGLVDCLAKKFPKNTAKVVKETLNYVAWRGRKKGDTWELFEGRS